MRNRWSFRREHFSHESYDLPPLIARILSARGISPHDAYKFLNPSIEFLSSPSLLRDIQSAVDRIEEALRYNEKIMIHGDYDVDGVTSLALLERNLRRLGLTHIVPYIPDRFDEGYGLSLRGIQRAKEEGISLIITVDCGTTALNEIRKANELGIDIIVTDHHEPADVLPDALAVVNPVVEKENLNELAGVGVVFKLLEALYDRLGLDRKILLWDLDLVALGTVADIAPLTGENRIFVSYGLKVLENTLKVGLKALKKVSGLSGKIDTWHISFILAPRLNAAGRLSHAEKAYRLLVTKDGEEALKLAEELDSENRRRQDIEKKIFDEAVRMVEEDYREDFVLVIGKEDWHEGVIGIVASKLVEKYYKPAILVSLREEGKGSARSIPAFHLFKALKEVEELFISFGGHKYAAGFRMAPKNLVELRKRLNRRARETMRREDFIPIIEIDAEAKLDELDERFFELYEKLSPFGPGNPVPVIKFDNLEVVGEVKKVGDNHLKFALRDGKNHLQCIAYDMGHLEDKIIRGLTRVDVVGQFTKDNFGVREEWVLKVLDMRIR